MRPALGFVSAPVAGARPFPPVAFLFGVCFFCVANQHKESLALRLAATVNKQEERGHATLIHAAIGSLASVTAATLSSIIASAARVSSRRSRQSG